MRYLLNKESSIKAIANAIRSKTGSTDNLTVANMPEAISNISGGGSGNLLSINIDDYSNLQVWGWPSEDYYEEDEDFNYNEFINSDIVIVSNSLVIIRNQNLCNTIESHLATEPNFSNISTDPVSDNVYMPHSLCLYKFNLDENNIIVDEYLAIPKSLRYGYYNAEAGGTPIGYTHYCKMIDMINIEYDYHLQYNNEYINTIYYDGERGDNPNRYASGNTILLAPNWNGPYTMDE